MASNLIGDRLDAVLEAVLADADDGVLVVNPTGDVIERFVDVATALDEELPTIRILAEKRVLKDVMEDFIVASTAADLVEGGGLDMRTVSEHPSSSLLVTDDRVIALVDAGSKFAGLIDDDPEFVDAARESYESRWDEADEYALRTPPLSKVRETLAEEIGSEAEADFVRILDSLETARGDGDGLDEVTISLLVAATNQALLYDISKWGEDIGIASKATFSRTKTQLEDMGLIDTEKVPIDVGRPRLRLKLGDERLRDASDEEFASLAQSLLA